MIKSNLVRKSSQILCLVAILAVIIKSKFLIASSSAFDTSTSGSVNSNYNGDCPVTIIEDQNTVPSGLFIYTGDNNYAIFSPNLTAKNWQTITVNENNISIISLKNNKTLNTKIGVLSDQTKSQLLMIKDNFNKNLAGLTFSSCSYTSTNNVDSTYPAAAAAEISYENLQSARKLDLIVNKQKRSQYDINNNYVNSYSTSTAPTLPILSASLNYYNIFNSKLNDSLIGDVYQFCINQPFVDIYSTTVSVRQNKISTTFYRDYKYFAYRKQNMPLNINLFFLNDNFVFFVYNDKTISIKSNTQLNIKELDLVVEARALIRVYQGLVQDAIDLQNDDNLPFENVIDQ